MEILFIWLAVATVTGLAANGRGRSFGGWFIMGILFSIFALIAVLVMPRLDEQPSADTPYRASQPARSSSSVTRVASRYMGHAILSRDGEFHVLGIAFPTEADARRFLELRSGATPVSSKAIVTEHMGHDIRLENRTYYALGEAFRTEVDARKHISDTLENTPSDTRQSSIGRVQGSSLFDQVVVGTKSYQQAIRALPKQRGKFIVRLVCQPDNPYDKNAVEVSHNGQTLGFLPREDAEEWREALSDEGWGTDPVEVYARIVRSDDHETLGLRLDMDWPPDLIRA